MTITIATTQINHNDILKKTVIQLHWDKRERYDVTVIDEFNQREKKSTYDFETAIKLYFKKVTQAFNEVFSE